jgi:diacylglycerol kinase family enzyme
MGTAVAGVGGRIPVFLNPRAGGRDQTDTAARVIQLFAARGIQASIESWPGAGHVAAAVREAARGATAVVAGGGDGTVSTVASALVGTDVRLGVLPIGTLNHFAKDAGIPLDLEKAVAAIAEGRSIAVDVGEVNGRTFLNNCSIGLYPTIVRSRESLERQGHGKWWAFVLSAFRILPRHHRLRVVLDADGRPSAWRTPFVMVANNAYEVSGVHFGARASLTGGRLFAYVAPRIRARDLPASVLKAVFARLSREASGVPEEFRSVSASHLRIGIEGNSTIPVAIDGEVGTTPVPIECRCRQAALQVFVPGTGT